MTNVKILLTGCLLIVFGFHAQAQHATTTGTEILERSKQKHDPDGQWSNTELSIHIQEPRIQNRLRYSQLAMYTKTGYFKLVRDSEPGIIERIIDHEGNAQVLLNGSPEIADDIKEKYRLGADRNTGYRSFYRLMYGLPMSLTEDVVEEIGKPKESNFAGQEVYSLEIELKEPMISKKWELMLDRVDYSMVALKFDHADDSNRPNEVILFDGKYRWEGISIPRFRHWYHEDSGAYQGSDVIVNNLDQ
ncbi:MAG: hypothetical protein RI564_00445 [Gracilimonas sp.]|nr:hypothetical protein [Gracilimonas sp.]